MAFETDPLFRDDAYLRSCEATVAAVNERNGIILDRTIFYATGGGQPGDTGELELADGTRIAIATTVYGEDKSEIVHVPASDEHMPKAGDKVVVHVNWAQRYDRMRMHTALHLLSAILPYPVTGGQIGDGSGRLDFDVPEATLDKADITEKLMALVNGAHETATRWITDEELEANPGLVKTMSVKPPMGSGKVRLVSIGNDSVDLQPCGGTHVANTQEISDIYVSKIEKKGRQNRRVRLTFGTPA
ncbi:alanyl-tRNA editing protein [Coralliovum pocilloporae]|uniref:alanyl-tRNA editing protein n=1 Tax=Coralliovum pocilloporae TaxID=3066369 RepID=UPI0033078E0F